MTSNIIASIPKLKGRENYEEWAFAVEHFLILPNDAKARAKIILTIDPGLYVYIKEESSAMGLWNKLKTMYTDTSFTRRIGLLRNLISIRRTEITVNMAVAIALMPV
ncbi:unnamed protein product [Hermetia illucens]|uniref:Uncharacterized protein n=1 Tax=Hermetia illucens TaxID=343691 RepID=A0A7R8UPK6_HERIL|nr:unnamed protein product [Hermetia illucens]